MKPPPPCFEQKANAIRNINNTIRKPGYIPTDFMLVAVTVMTLLEVTYCFQIQRKDRLIRDTGSFWRTNSMHNSQKRPTNHGQS
jgi:hypothetical protein